MKHYRDVLGKVEGLQRGFTSGTCAQVASKGAMMMLISQEKINEVEVALKNGTKLMIPVLNQVIEQNQVSCSVIKDSGDDSDISHGKEFTAQVCWSEKAGVEILGGEGVGLITKAGLPISPGNPAINPNPLKMMRKELLPLIAEGKGIKVTISVPEGRELAKMTWNPRLGIEGGISIIGTSGIIEPKSSTSYKASIALSMNVLKKNGANRVYITPGYVGEAYLQKRFNCKEEELIKVGDHMGFALDCAKNKGFPQIYFVGHIGKMVKIAAGIFNTHCKYGDARLETIAAFAAAAGASQQDVIELLDLNMAEAAVPFLNERDLMKTFVLINERVVKRSLLRIEGDFKFVSIIVDLKGELLSELSHE